VKIVVDTYAWIELLIGSEKGARVKEILQNAEKICTPSTVVAEVARKFLREGIEEETIALWLETITDASEIIQIDPATALEAAKSQILLYEKAKKARQNTPSLFDAIVHANAKINQCKILTGDQHFEDLPETIWVN
jgi:predicted nucleic acid-binding protein